jgi:hypothetical protein
MTSSMVLLFIQKESDAIGAFSLTHSSFALIDLQLPTKLCFESFSYLYLFIYLFIIVVYEIQLAEQYKKSTNLPKPYPQERLNKSTNSYVVR